MRYILIPGVRDAGKSTTIDAVCKRLNADEIFQLIDSLQPVDASTFLGNATYLLRIKDKHVLAVSGSTTEQSRTITSIIEVCIKLEITIDVALVAMRSYEQKDGYNTPLELQGLGELIEVYRIHKIGVENFQETTEWKDRIDHIVDLVNRALNDPQSAATAA